jgi:hypothetical protein
LRWSLSFNQSKNNYQKNMIKERYIPSTYVPYTPEIGEYPKDLFACYVDTERNIAIFYKGKSNKPVFHNRFRNAEDMGKKINGTISSLMRWEDQKLERKNARKEALAQPHNLKVGDVLYTSWGYEQTNVDFYQVTKLVGKRSVEIRPVAQTTEQSQAYADYVVPVKDAFRGDAELKRVSTSNTVNIASYASASLWDGRGVYQTALGYGH